MTISAPKVALLRLQASQACNLDCSYCYIPQSMRRQTGLMSMAVLRTTLQRLVDEDLLLPQLTVSWHCAEPLTAGLDWYEAASVCIAETLGDRCAVKQVFQSNGVLLDDAWCEYFERHDAQIGVSIDGTASQNAHRVNWGNRPAHALALRGIAALNRHQLRWALLAVVTRETMSDAAAFIDFVRSSGCSYLGFKVEESNGAHSSKLVDAAATRDAYAGFVQQLWRAFPENGAIEVREFDQYRRHRHSGGPTQALPVTILPFRNLTVTYDGDFTVFSGDLLYGDYDRFVFGNVQDAPLLDCLLSPRFDLLAKEILAGVKRCAANCDHYNVCGSYFIHQKYAETGRFDVDETLTCRLEIKTLYAALDRISAN